MAAASDAAMLETFERLALAAGGPVMEVFRSSFAVDRKSDSSPVTEADLAAEKIILAGLREAYPSIACVAEEEAAAGLSPAALGEAFFLIDPLDGTKEFINKATDFTINIALVRNGAPVAGLVYAPAQGVLWGGAGGAAFRLEVDGDHRPGQRRPIRARARPTPCAVVASKSHRTPETDEYIAKFPGCDLVSVGSSLKFCLVAEGQADLYPRFGRTMEWDTAAGDAVLRAAGGTTVTLDGKPLVYGKLNQATDSDFANPWFISEGRAAG